MTSSLSEQIHLDQKDLIDNNSEASDISEDENDRITPTDQINELKEKLTKISTHYTVYHDIASKLNIFVDQIKKAEEGIIPKENLYVKIKLPVLLNPYCFIEAEYRLSKDTIVSLGQGYFRNISIFEMLEMVQKNVEKYSNEMDSIQNEISQLENELFRGLDNIDAIFDRLEEEERMEDMIRGVDSGDLDKEFSKFFVKNDRAARHEARILANASDEEDFDANIQEERMRFQEKIKSERKETISERKDLNSILKKNDDKQKKKVHFHESVIENEFPKPNVPLHVPSPQSNRFQPLPSVIAQNTVENPDGKAFSVTEVSSSNNAEIQSKLSAPVIQERITEKSTSKPPSIPMFPGATNKGNPPSFPTFPKSR